VTHFERFDDPDLRPADALPYVVSMASLAREVDGQRFNPDELALLTVHQAKGLEFDTVFIAGAAENEFPNRRSLREGREAEEHRLFYVAVSRAKRRLFLSYSLLNSWGREQMRSRYTRLIVDRS
jgi:DNA helicase-2/ATP-dependent DNA helicase PcrA